jgi:hypothetical protein
VAYGEHDIVIAAINSYPVASSAEVSDSMVKPLVSYGVSGIQQKSLMSGLHKA